MLLNNYLKIQKIPATSFEWVVVEVLVYANVYCVFEFEKFLIGVVKAEPEPERDEAG